LAGIYYFFLTHTALIFTEKKRLWLSLEVTPKVPPTGGIAEEFKMNTRLKSPLKQKGSYIISTFNKIQQLKA
jgi:hypothetical protein